MVLVEKNEHLDKEKDKSMKEILKMEKGMVLEKCFIRISMFIMGNEKKIKSMDMAFTLMKMEKNMKGFSLKVIYKGFIRNYAIYFFSRVKNLI